MALPTGTTHGSGLSRSEAAILAWKKRKAGMSAPAGGLDPKIAARVKEILAGKLKKGKAKAKGKAPKKAAKPKLTDAQKQAEKDKKKAEADKVKAAERGKNLTKVGDATDLGDHLANLDKFKSGRGLKDKDAAELEKQGLVERGKDGTVRMSGAGNAVLSAAARGDSQGAKDAASRGRDAAAGKQERASASADREKTKAAKLTERAAKQKQQKQAQQKKAKARQKIASDKAKAKADKEKATPAPVLHNLPKGFTMPAASAAPQPPKAKKAVDMPEYAIKQSDEERAMFAAMDEKGTRKTPKSSGDKAKGGGGGGGGSSSGSSGKTIPHGPKGKEAGFGKPATYSGRKEQSFGHAGDTSNYGNHDPIGFVREHHKGSGTYNVEKGGGHGGTGSPETLASNLTLSEARQAAHLVARHTHSTANTAYGASHKLNTETLKQDPDYTALTGKIKARRAEGKAMDELFSLDDLLAIKAGARHSKTDMQHLQGIHDSAVACGASCGPESDNSAEADGDDLEDAGKAIKGIMEDPQFYATHECGDIMQGANALSTIAMLLASELSEDDEDDAHIAMLCDAARTLVKFIGSELDELEGAAGDAADTARMGPMNKGIEIATLDDSEQIAVLHGYSVKALDAEGLVGGYLVKFGGDGDLSPMRDVFTKDTNFGTHTKSAVWVHHRMLPGLGKKELTNQAELGMDDEGVFVKHLLDLRNVYEAKLYDMAKNNKLGWSSGTAPNLVERKALGDGRHEITQWPLGLDASYTPMPAGGFVVNASAMKSLLHDAGIDLLNAMYIDDSPEAIKSDSTRPDGVEVDDARARRLLLEIELLQLMETA